MSYARRKHPAPLPARAPHLQAAVPASMKVLGGLELNAHMSSPAGFRRELAAFFLLTFALSWAIEVPLALSAQGLIHASVPFWLHYLASFGPLCAAVIVTLVTRGPRGTARLLSGLARWRIKPIYWTVAVVAPCTIFAVLVLATRVARGAWPDLAALGQPDYLPALGIPATLLLWTATFGVGEEVGWRGFALPRLQAGRSAFSASMRLGALWAVWHLPALFYRDTYLEMGLLVIPMLLTVAAVGSTVYTWMYNGTGGSLLALVVFHGLFDFFSVWPAGVLGPGMLMTVLMVFWAVRVFKLHGPATLAPADKVSL
jgi:membrane protease YdiL (CAAX protease family)